MDAVTNALAGMGVATRAFERSASALASAVTGGSPLDTVTAVVGLLDARNGFEINAAVLRTATDMQRRLLDVVV